MTHTIEKIKQELQNAYHAQAQGNPGRARVCARRAAGWAIQINLNRQGIDLSTPSAFDYIKYLHQQENPEEIQKTLEHLQVKVAKDSLEEESYWPLPDIDLIEEARWLAEQMLGEKIAL